jgi:phospholipid/cholesterol/gamma-HCH transport system substrate-binding protein
MEEGFTHKEKVVGLFFLVLLVLFIFSLVLVSREKGWLFFQRTYLVKFAEGYNLQVGSPVKMLATEIGKVTKIAIDFKTTAFPVIVTIRVFGNYSSLIKEDSEAYAVSPLFIGTAYLAVTAGSSPNVLPDYHVIPTGYRRSMTESLESLASEQNIEQIKATLANLAQMTEALKNDEKSFFAAVDAFKQVFVALKDGKGTLGQLVVSRELYTSLNKSVNELNKVLANATQVAGEMKPTAQDLQKFARSIQEEVTTLKSILADIKSGAADFKAGAAEFPGVMQTAGETMQGGKEVVDAVKANPLVKMTMPKQRRSQPVHVEPRDVP